MLRVRLVRVSDHAEHALVLRHAVNRELGVENLVPTVFAVGLRKHHQFDIGRVALQLREGLYQIVDLIQRQGQAKLRVGGCQRRPAAAQHIDMRHRGRLQLTEQSAGTGTVKHDALGHAVMQQAADLPQLHLGQTCLAQQTTLEADAVFDHPLHAAHREAAVVGDVGGLRRPGRDRAKTRRYDDQRPVGGAGIRLAIGQQSRQLFIQCQRRLRFRAHQMHKPRGDTADLVVNHLQARQQLLNTKTSQSAAALELADVQGHGEGLEWVADWVDDSPADKALRGLIGKTWILTGQKPGTRRVYAENGRRRTPAPVQRGLSKKR